MFMTIVICTNTQHVWRNIILLFIAAPFLIYTFEEEGLLIILIIGLPVFVLKQLGLELSFKKVVTGEEVNPFATSFDTEEVSESAGPKDLFEKAPRMFSHHMDFIDRNENVDEIVENKDNTENTEKENKVEEEEKENKETAENPEGAANQTSEAEDEANLRQYMDFCLKVNS